MEFPLGMKRQDAFPLDDSSVFYSLEDAQAYAQSNPTAYVGQILSVVVNGESTAYQIKNAAGDLDPLGTGDMDENLGRLLRGQHGHRRGSPGDAR